MNKIVTFSLSYSCFGISAMDTIVSKSILRGRPFGGVATLVRNDLAHCVKCLKCADRYNIILIGTVLLINVYLPCQSRDSDRIISSIFADLADVVSLYPNHTVLLGGDLNTDLTNIRSSTTILVLKFMQDFDLLNCDGLIKLNSNFTYFHEAQQQQSIIDYFIISNSAKDTVKEHAV